MQPKPRYGPSLSQQYVCCCKRSSVLIYFYLQFIHKIFLSTWPETKIVGSPFMGTIPHFVIKDYHLCQNISKQVYESNTMLLKYIYDIC